MKNHITTDDFYLASFLLANDVSLVKHVRQDNSSTFEFSGSDVNALVHSYYQDSANVSPLAFAKAIRNLKNIMYNSTTFYNQSSNENAIRTNRKDDECLHS
jgi:hypothetical protein